MGRSNNQNRPMTLPPRAAQHLDELLGYVADGGMHAHHRRADRLAITIRPCKRNREAMPEGLVEFDAWRLFALSHRWSKGGIRGVRRRLPLAIYKPVIDLPGTGRIRFVCERVYDAASRGVSYAPSAADNPSAARAAVLLHQAAEDARPEELTPTLALPEFYFAFFPDELPTFEPRFTPEEWAGARRDVEGMALWPAWLFIRPAQGRWETHPGDGSAPPAADVIAAEGDLSPDGAWVLADGIWTPLCQEPAAVIADFTGMEKRTVRNPAWGVLRKHGLIPQTGSYRQWLDKLGSRWVDRSPEAAATESEPEPEPTTDAGGDGYVPLPEPDPEPAWMSPVDTFLAQVEAYALAEDENGQYPKQEELFRDLRAACDALAIRVPEGKESANEFFAELLLAPWQDLDIDWQAALQVVKLSGAPDPATMIFRCAHLTIDLFDLGKEAEYYEPVPARVVAEMLRQQPGRGWGKYAWQKATL